MTDISFYHLTVRPLEWALPKLLERTLDGGNRALIMVSSTERMNSLNALLWTYEPNSWLPHGVEKDGNAVEHPIWLTTRDENPNGANFLFLTDGAASAKVAEFARVFELLDGRDEGAVRAARGHWKTYMEAGYDLSYWQQDDRGRWVKAK
ncbi:MAG: DNA polymerase III subunit chi [Rhodospirillaceae bacterium]|nr:DNA polymerase III subunit chi [Rhodospirillaceae bacterium]